MTAAETSYFYFTLDFLFAVILVDVGILSRLGFLLLNLNGFLFLPSDLNKILSLISYPVKYSVNIQRSIIL